MSDKNYPIASGQESISPSEKMVDMNVGEVLNGRVLLGTYQPDRVYRVTITGYVEIDFSTEITSSTQFKVDYNNGAVYFDSSQEGVNITISEFWAKGRIYLDADSVIMGDGGTLDELEDKVDEHIAGTDNRHDTDAIDNVSVVSGSTQSDVNENLKAEIDTLVLNPANTTIGVFPVEDTINTNTYAGTFVSLTLFDRLRVNLRVTNTNTGTSTLDLNGLGAYAIVNKDGSTLSGGEIYGTIELEYDLSNARWELINTETISLIKNATIECYNIKVNAGVFDFSATNLTGRKWYFADRTTSTDENPTRTLAKAQTVRLEGYFGISPSCVVMDNATDSVYVGDLADIPSLTYYLSLNNCTNMTGDLSDLPNLSHYLILSNCPLVTGDLADLPNLSYYLNLNNNSNIMGGLVDLPSLSYYLNLNNCPSITGDLSDLPLLSYYLDLSSCSLITGDLADLPNLSYYLSLSGCINITGSLNPEQTVQFIVLSNINCTNLELDTTLANLVVANKSNGSLTLTGLVRTVASDADRATLVSRGWTITGDTIG